MLHPAREAALGKRGYSIGIAILKISLITGIKVFAAVTMVTEVICK